jgi:hypothetical protein
MFPGLSVLTKVFVLINQVRLFDISSNDVQSTAFPKLNTTPNVTNAEYPKIVFFVPLTDKHCVV